MFLMPMESQLVNTPLAVLTELNFYQIKTTRLGCGPSWTEGWTSLSTCEVC